MAVSLYLASLAGVVGKSLHMHNQDSEWVLYMAVIARLKLSYLVVWLLPQSQAIELCQSQSWSEGGLGSGAGSPIESYRALIAPHPLTREVGTAAQKCNLLSSSLSNAFPAPAKRTIASVINLQGDTPSPGKR